MVIHVSGLLFCFFIISFILRLIFASVEESEGLLSQRECAADLYMYVFNLINMHGL